MLTSNLRNLVSDSGRTQKEIAVALGLDSNVLISMSLDVVSPTLQP